MVPHLKAANSGRRIFVQVAVEGRPADTQELGDVLAGVAVGLHPPGGGDGGLSHGLSYRGPVERICWLSDLVRVVGGVSGGISRSDSPEAVENWAVGPGVN